MKSRTAKIALFVPTAILYQLGVIVKFIVMAFMQGYRDLGLKENNNV